MPRQKSFDLKPTPPDPRVAALSGPRELKTPGSEPWVIQTVFHAQGIWSSLKRDTKDWQKVVTELDTQEVWRKYPNGKPYGTREAFYQGELGAPEPELTRVKVEQQAALPNGGARAGAGRKPKGASQEGAARQVDQVRVNPGGNSKASIMRTLLRDAPALAAKVESGEKSAKQAAVEAGIRRRRIEILDGDPAYLAAQLERQLGREVIDKVCAILRPGSSQEGSSAATSTQSNIRLIDGVVVPTGQAGTTIDTLLLAKWRRKDREGGNITPELYIHRRRVEIMDGPPGDILAQLDQHWPRVFAMWDNSLPKWMGGSANRSTKSQLSRNRHSAGDGSFKARSHSPFSGPLYNEALRDFKRLNTRASRAAFADHWIGIWASGIDDAWQILYELLKIIEEDQLYKDPRRVGPQAPGYPKETHAKESAYPDFKAYFTERVRKPFVRWAELERVHQYARKYAPEIFELP